jgi:hypothetical protein
MGVKKVLIITHNEPTIIAMAGALPDPTVKAPFLTNMILLITY